MLFTKAINGRLTLNGSLADHCLTPSCLCVLRRDAEARHNVGFFRYGAITRFRMCGLLRFTRRKLYRLFRRWFVYLSIAGAMGNANRLFEHFSLWKSWHLVKGIVAHWVVY
ncbi:hypothetical protein [Pseudomonas sp. NPDC012596]|uniref:hypothetical protein n=1 Tax=Pseudomonas sp. NPDC012596 TaxID=3364419 RepID=UPI0036A34FD8